jgi:hypothetical protein
MKRAAITFLLRIAFVDFSQRFFEPAQADSIDGEEN